MHCFIPFSDYSNDRHIQIVSMMRAELIKKGTPCTSIVSVVGKDENGIHFHSWNDMKEGIVIYDPEESITSYHVHKVGETHIQSIP